MRHTFAFLALASVFVASAPAIAQSTDNSSARCANTPATASGDQTYCFNGEDVSGGVVGPYGQGTRVLRPMHGPSLLRIRAHFVPQMMKSVENL